MEAYTVERQTTKDGRKVDVLIGPGPYMDTDEHHGMSWIRIEFPFETIGKGEGIEGLRAQMNDWMEDRPVHRICAMLNAGQVKEAWGLIEEMMKDEAQGNLGRVQ